MKTAHSLGQNWIIGKDNIDVVPGSTYLGIKVNRTNDITQKIMAKEPNHYVFHVHSSRRHMYKETPNLLYVKLS